MNQVNSLKINDGKLIGQYCTNRKYIFDASSILTEKYFSIKSSRLIVTDTMIPNVAFNYNKLACRGLSDDLYETFSNKVHYFTSSLQTATNNPSNNDSISYSIAKGFSLNIGGPNNTRPFCELISGYFCPKQNNNYRKSGYFTITTARTDLKIRSVVITSADYGEYWTGVTYSDYAMPCYTIAYCVDNNTLHEVHWHKTSSIGHGYNAGDSEKVYYMAFLSN